MADKPQEVVIEDDKPFDANKTGRKNAMVMRSDDFATTQAVTDDGGRLYVPVDADANRRSNQVIAESMRKLLKKHIKAFGALKQPLLPKELMDLTVAAKNIAEMSYKAHEGAPPSLEPGRGALGTVAYAVAKGMSDAKHLKSPEELMEAIDKMAKGASHIAIPDRKTEKVVNPAPDESRTAG